MDFSCGEIWHVQRERLSTRAVEKYAIGVGLQPSLSAPNLLGRIEYSAPKPSTPNKFNVLIIWEDTIFIREYEDMILKDYQEITDFLSITLSVLSLISVDARVAP
jgi:hypothetical protein